MHDRNWYKQNYEFYKAAYVALLAKKRELETENTNLKWRLRKYENK